MRIGTRGSELAKTQTDTVAARIAERLGHSPEVVIIQTQGDLVTDRPLRELEGRGYFTKELEEALLDRRIDAAVHSFKDMPSRCPEGLTIAAISDREDPADVLIVRPDVHRENLGPIPVAAGSVVGTSAVRREMQVRARRTDLRTTDLRGNVPTRVNKLREGKYDAIFLASAGIRRLGLDLSDLIVVRLDPTWFVPSPGQGALAVEMRAGDPNELLVSAAIHDAGTATATRIERTVQARFGGGCGLPLGVFAQQESGEWTVHGFWGGLKDTPVWSAVRGINPEKLAEDLFYSLTKETPCPAQS